MTDARATKMQIFNEAVKITDLEARVAYLGDACGDDHGLREEIDELLRHDAEAGSFLSAIGSRIAAPNKKTACVTEKPGMTIDKYRLLQEIGEGGMGAVFLAQQREPVRRKVALKIIKPGMDTREVLGRFEAERQALAIMDHPNIARVLDGGSTESGRPYFVMEYVRGMPITNFCDEAKVTTEERLRLFVSVCAAVQHAHQKGIIHRDIKPGNVLVTLFGETAVTKIIDFGVAKAIDRELTEKTVFTGHGQVVGTPLYMSPEQVAISGLDVDTRSDIYSLGVLLYELLTGSTPFHKEHLLKAGFDEMRRVIREEEPPRPSTRVTTLGGEAESVAICRQTEPTKLSRLLRGELDWIVMKALDKDRTRRYETADGFVRDVQRYLNDEPVEACPPSLRYRFRKFARKNKSVIATVTAVIIALIVGGSIATWQAVRATQANSQLKRNRQELLDVIETSIDMRALTLNLTGGLMSPRRVTQGPDGNVYVCSAENNSVFKYDGTTGELIKPIVSKGAGGLREPIGLTFGPDGDMYVASAKNDRVIRYDGTTGEFRDVFIESGSGGLDRPSDLVFGPDGHLYVTGDTTAVKRYDGKTGEFIDDFIAGNAGVAQLRKLIFRPDGKLYIVRFDVPGVLCYDAKTGEFDQVFVSADRAELCWPADMVFANDGRLFVVCHQSSCVLQYDGMTGVFERVLIESGRGGLRGPTGIALHADGSLLVSSRHTDEILRYDAQTGEYLGPFISSRISRANGYDMFSMAMLNWHLGRRDVARHHFARGADWVAKHQSNNERLKKYQDKAAALLGETIPAPQFPVVSINSCVITEGDDSPHFRQSFVGFRSGGLLRPRSLNFENGHLYVVDENGHAVHRYDAKTGANVGIFAPDLMSKTSLNRPIAAAFGQSGSLYVLEFNTDQVLRYDSAGRFKEVFVNAGEGGLRNPICLAFDRDGNLYVTAAHDNCVFRYDRSGLPCPGPHGNPASAEFVPSGSGGLASARGLLFDGDGHLYVASIGNDCVLKYSGADGSFIEEFVAEGSGGLDQPHSMVWGPDGNLYVASENLDSVFRYRSDDGSFIDVFIPRGCGGLNNPMGIAFDQSGRFYVASANTSEVLQFSSESEAMFTVALSENCQQPVTVRFETVDGSAVAPADYANTSGTIHFAPGETSKAVFVPVFNDNDPEPTETFSVRLFDAMHAQVKGHGLATINDDDHEQRSKEAKD